jgi:hypothetical protein
MRGNSTKAFIICGRGQSKYNCEGNIVFRRIIATHLDDYMTDATRAKKSSIIKCVVEELRNLGMIFMAIEEDGISMRELSSGEAREKVAHRFRDATRMVKKLGSREKGEYPTIKQTSFDRHPNKMNLSPSIHSPVIQHPNSMDVTRHILISESFESEDMYQEKQHTDTTADSFQFHSKNNFEGFKEYDIAPCPVKSTDFISQESMFIWNYPELSPLHSGSLLSMSSDDDTECQSFENETSPEIEDMFNDFLGVFDDNETCDMLSLLLKPTTTIDHLTFD